MSKRKTTPPIRSLRPQAESLETRQLLSSTNFTNPTAVARGTDPDGTQWSLFLYGPGALSVVGVDALVPDPPGRHRIPRTRSRRSRWAGRSRRQTQLVGTVQKHHWRIEGLLREPPEYHHLQTNWARSAAGQVNNFRSVQNGIEAIDMPDFSPAHTELTKPSDQSVIHSNGSTFSAGQIFIPQGVLTLLFGGVDVDYTPPGGVALNTTGQSNEFQIVLGLPIVEGTSIIVNTVNSDAEANYHLAQHTHSRITRRSWWTAD